MRKLKKSSTCSDHESCRPTFSERPSGSFGCSMLQPRSRISLYRRVIDSRNCTATDKGNGASDSMTSGGSASLGAKATLMMSKLLITIEES